MLTDDQLLVVGIDVRGASVKVDVVRLFGVVVEVHVDAERSCIWTVTDAIGSIGCG